MVKDWEKAKENIYRYYIKDGNSLQQVQTIMKDKHHFDASIRSYKSKLDTWGPDYRKNHKHRNASPSSLAEKSKGSEASGVIIYSNTPADAALIGFGCKYSTNSPLDGWNNAKLLPPIITSYEATAQNNRELPLDTCMKGQDLTVSLFHGNPVLVNPSHGTVDFNTRDSRGRTFLHRAVIEKDTDDLEFLLSNGHPVDLQDNYGYHPLHYAAKEGDSNIIEVLLKWGANPNATGFEGRTPLHLVLHSDQALKALLKAPPAVSAQDNLGETALHLAIVAHFGNGGRDCRVIEELIRSGADVNIQNTSGTSPFHLVATRKPSIRLLVLFLTNGADVTLPHHGVLPFQAFLGQINQNFYCLDPLCRTAIKLFLLKGADPNTRAETGHHTISHTLLDLCSDDEDIFKIVLETVDLDIPTSKGDYPLHTVFRRPPFIQCYTTHLKILLRRGVDTNQLNPSGESPLTVLLRSQAYPQADLEGDIFQVLKALVEGGADIMRRDALGNLSIYLAMTNYLGERREQLIKFLVDCYTDSKMSPCSPVNSSDDQEWWDKYYVLRRQRRWSTSTRFMVSAEGMPSEMQVVLPRMLLGLAAEDILQGSQNHFLELKTRLGLLHIDTQMERDHFMLILRDCDSLELAIKPAWYRVPLRLFEGY
ncbi:hypothetical protein MMC30_001627 [Trapelia coarctata]|nr:hypothetical protein [Trapelia coarctata]